MPPRPNGPRLSMKESMKQLDKKTLFRLLSYMKPYRLQYEFCQGYFLPKLYIFSVHYS